MANEIRCSKCGSTQIMANKKGFNGRAAFVGNLFLGPVGLLCGCKGSGRTFVTCLVCGYSWEIQIQPYRDIVKAKNPSRQNGREEPRHIQSRTEIIHNWKIVLGWLALAVFTGLLLYFLLSPLN